MLDPNLIILENQSKQRVDQLNNIFTLLQNSEKMCSDANQFHQLLEDMDLEKYGKISQYSFKSSKSRRNNE